MQRSQDRTSDNNVNDYYIYSIDILSDKKNFMTKPSYDLLFTG